MFFDVGAKRIGIQGILALTCLAMLPTSVWCQEGPGINGMAPKKWIAIRHTQAPGRSFRSINSNEKVCTQEDIYFKLWLPVVHNSKFAMAIGPQYRTEQLEFESHDENPVHALSHWNLRYIGADIRSMISLTSSSWLMFNVNANKSGNINDYRLNQYPLNYTFSGAFLKKKSGDQEFGAGLLVNKGFTGVTVLPILIYHYNFSKKTGIEISLPYKAAFRYNISSSDILYAKAESLNRDYLIRSENAQCSFRTINVDMGVAYNKTFSKLIGAEAFIGYRQNITNRLPQDVMAVRKSGVAFSLELYIRPPFK